jgi:hypothetical protein
VQSEAEEVWLSIGRIFHRLTLTGQVSPDTFIFIFYFSEANFKLLLIIVKQSQNLSEF